MTARGHRTVISIILSPCLESVVLVPSLDLSRASWKSESPPLVTINRLHGDVIVVVAIYRKQASMWVAGDVERERNRIHHYRESDKLRKIEKQDKLDKLEKLELMDGSDRVKHLEAQMLSKIRAMDLEPKMMEEEVCCS